MKKKIFSLFMIIFIIFPCMFMITGCKKSSTDNDSSNNSGGSNGGSGGGSGGGNSQVVSTLYDMRFTTYKYSDHTSYSQTPYGGQLIWLPDGKTMVVDLCIESEIDDNLDFVQFYEDFTNYSKHDSSGKPVIDYFVVTNEKKVAIDSLFFDNFTIKNFYRPNMEIDLDYWRSDNQKIVGNDTYIFEHNIEDLKSINPEHLTGLPRKYFEDCTDLDPNNPNNTVLQYNYNDYYIISLYLAEQNNVNIIKLTDNSDISKTLSYNGNDYTYTIDFFMPEPKINPTFENAFHNIIVNGQISNEFYISSHIYYQAEEFNTAFSINYGEFDLLYLDRPSFNVLNWVIENHNENKKYDVLLGHYRFNDSSENFFDVWAKNLLSYQDKGVFALTKLFDKTKIDSNYLIIPMASSISGTRFTTNSSLYFYDSSLVEVALKSQNQIRPARIKNGNLNIPILKVLAGGEHSVQVLDDKFTYCDLLKPTINGQLVQN